MLAQLDRLVAATTLPNLRLGVIGFSTAYSRIPDHGFWIIDDKLVQIETATAELNLTQADEITAYAASFRQFAGLAQYGDRARAIIGDVMSTLRLQAQA
jgi:hypothetical protein